MEKQNKSVKQERLSGLFCETEIVLILLIEDARVHVYNDKAIFRRFGALAQLGERLVRNEEVGGSIPLCSTKQQTVSESHLPRWSRWVRIFSYLQR